MSARMLMTAGPQGLVVRITQAMRDPQVRTLAVAAGWDGVKPFTIEIAEGVDVAALRILSSAGGWDVPDDVLTIVNRGRLGGLAGTGFNDATRYGLRTQRRIKVINLGQIFGAGGDGGQGSLASCYYWYVNPVNYIQSSSGDPGRGQGFNRSSALSGPTIPITPKTTGQQGAVVTYSGAVGGGAAAWCRGGTSGNGGDIGQAGTAGSTDVGYGGTYVSPNTSQAFAGFPCAAVQGNSLITWIAQGNITGALT